jgi:hypothetical protein
MNEESSRSQTPWEIYVFDTAHIWLSYGGGIKMKDVIPQDPVE